FRHHGRANPRTIRPRRHRAHVRTQLPDRATARNAHGEIAMKIFTALLLCATSYAQVAADANKAYKTKEGRDGVAKTLDNPNRDKNQKPEEIIALMEIKPGMSVADIGTGTGFMVPYLSKAVGPAGKVFAEDIAQDFLDRAKTKAEPNVTVILGTETDPKLPANSLDRALVLDVYHHFDYPDKMLANIARALK